MKMFDQKKIIKGQFSFNFSKQKNLLCVRCDAISFDWQYKAYCSWKQQKKFIVVSILVDVVVVPLIFLVGSQLTSRSPLCLLSYTGCQIRFKIYIKGKYLQQYTIYAYLEQTPQRRRKNEHMYTTLKTILVWVRSRGCFYVRVTQRKREKNLTLTSKRVDYDDSRSHNRQQPTHFSFLRVISFRFLMKLRSADLLSRKGWIDSHFGCGKGYQAITIIHSQMMQIYVYEKMIYYLESFCFRTTFCCVMWLYNPYIRQVGG